MSGILQTLFLGAAAAVKDAYFNLVTLLLNTTATNGAQNNTFLDSSTNNFTITRNGNTTQGTFTPFSQTGWSNYFNEATSDFVTVPNSTNFAFGTGDFTVEFWINTFDTAGGLIQLTGGTTGYWQASLSSSSFVWQSVRDTTNLYVTNIASSLNGQWHHVAVCRSGTTNRLFIDGTQVTSATDSTNYSGTAGNVQIAKDSAGNFYNGYISNLRIVKGTALYTTTFTPPTTPLTAISGTQLLTFQSNRYIDNSSNAYTVSVAGGTPSVQAFSPFAPTTAYDTAVVGGSGYFDGSGDYLSFTGPTIGTGAFCLEAWVYCTSTFTNQAIYGADGTNNRISILINNATTIAIDQYGVSGSTFTVPTMALNAWNHIAASRNGSSVATIFVNGVRSSTGTATLSNNYTTFGAIGRFASSDTRYPTGYIAGVRTTVGSTPYDPTQTTCTVPTAPPTAITNTSFLLNYTNAGIYDSAAKNDLETVGTAQVSTTQAKWGSTSMKFDGSTSSWLLVPFRPTLDLSTGSPDWTLECWGYVTNFTNSPYFFNKGGVAATYYTNYSFSMTGNTSSGTVYCTLGNNGGETSYTFGTCSVNTWYHFAATRSGNTIRTFLNGTLVTTQTIATAMTDNGEALYVGCLKNLTSNVLNGYIDDLRITRGYARYTANFTPPAAAFPIQ